MAFEIQMLQYCNMNYDNIVIYSGSEMNIISNVCLSKFAELKIRPVVVFWNKIKLRLLNS